MYEIAIKLILELIAALSWPIVFIISLFIFRKPFSRILSSISKVKIYKVDNIQFTIESDDKSKDKADLSKKIIEESWED